MEIKKFEAFKYSGPSINKLTRNDVLMQLRDNLTESTFGGSESTGSEFNFREEFLILYFDDYAIKFDLSDLGIEIGVSSFDEETGEENNFQPEINLDTDITKRIKAYKNTLGKFNI